MVNPGHSRPRADGEQIPAFGFNPPSAPLLGFEALDLAEVRRRVPDDRLHRAHRAEFHTITLITQGSGEHTVDFVTYPCRPGTLLWVRPGQVQRFDRGTALGGRHLMFTSAFPPETGVADGLGPTCWQLGTARDYATVASLVAQLTAERTRPNTVSQEILQFLLGALMLHIDRLPHQDVDGVRRAGEVYARFRSELERRYATTRRAADYAAYLGYTVKTLSRACNEATGHPVKHVIDARVALQARRLLAHTDRPMAAIALQLGFTEPTNFGKFFTRHTGTTPGEFRRLQREGSNVAVVFPERPDLQSGRVPGRTL